MRDRQEGALVLSNSTSAIHPPILINSSNGFQSLSPIILKNSSLAATSCPNGDRWVSLQDIRGNVRGRLLLIIVKLECVAGSNDTNDCEASMSTQNLNTGTYVKFLSIVLSMAGIHRLTDLSGVEISLVYLNVSNDNISQTAFTNGAWRDTGLIQAAASPANNTRLSVSTNIVPSLIIVNTTETSRAYLSSVVTYQSKNASFVMMNTDPDTQHAIYQNVDPISPNLFS